MTDEMRWDVGAAGAVVHEGRVLLVRATYGYAAGRWLLPGGYARHDERLDEAAVREVREETGVTTEVVDLIGMRTRYTERGGAVFALFRLRPVSGVLMPDGREVDRVAYFSAAEIEALGDDHLVPLSRNAALAALADRPGLREDRRLPVRSEAYHAFLV